MINEVQVISQKMVDDAEIVHIRFSRRFIKTNEDGSTEQIGADQYHRITLTKTDDISQMPEEVKNFCAAVWQP